VSCPTQFCLCHVNLYVLAITIIIIIIIIIADVFECHSLASTIVFDVNWSKHFIGIVREYSAYVTVYRRL